MRRAIPILAAAALLAALAAPARAAAPGECEAGFFGFCNLDLTFTGAEGEDAMDAGTHPFAMTTTIDPNLREDPDPEVGLIPDGQPRELIVRLPAGLTGSPDATPQCSSAEFAIRRVFLDGAVRLPGCTDSSVVGLARPRGSITAGSKVTEVPTPVYNLAPPPGVAARIGFQVPVVGSVVVDLDINESPPYNLIATSRNITQMQRFFGIDVTLWGDPGAPSHDDDRGLCGAGLEGEFAGADAGDFLDITCPVSIPPLPFITLPRRCAGPLVTLFEAVSWTGEVARGEALTHDGFGEPLGFGHCERLGFAPRISALPTAHAASAPSGLDFAVDIEDEGLGTVEGTAGSDIKKAVVTLPEGMTINPSQAEGLEVCTEAAYARERSDSAFGAGCPAAAKIGTVEVETPLLRGVLLRGSVFVAEPYRNPFGTLIALYMTIKEPRRGINIAIAGKVEPDPRTGQIRASFDDLPQQPFSHFRFHFREGGRSPLVTPPSCGTYETEALFTPWADPARPLPTTASFAVDRGPGGGPCPAPGAPPFEPGFEAGTQSNAAGSHSPFGMRFTRRDGDQDLTRLAAALPAGLVARLAGVSQCPDAQIALARAKSGVAELASPSCPSGSLIGTATGGAGAGSQLTYVSGRIYLAGPYNGAPLSVAAIVPAVAGPFDVGTILTRFALRIDPRTAEVRVDGERSDPIPHILAGIPLVVRDIRASVDRPDFTLNPTSCDPTAIATDIWGGGADPFDLADDLAVSRSARFQAAGCRGLGFRPRLSLRLRGGTGRGAHPALRGVFRPRRGDANLERLSLRLPRSAFLEQAHIRTICTRVQFRAGRCPKGAVYGHVRAYTPLLEGALSGPVYLRSSNHNLPDLVFVLRSSLGVDFEAVARIDSAQGGIRATFTKAPDAPLSRVIVDMQGADKGLIVNSTDLCAAKHRARARLRAHSGARRTLRPAVASVRCGKGRRARRAAHRRR